MRGFLFVDKEQGLTSRDVVNKLSKKLSIKRMGHSGTLDPIATGVLVVGVNDATRLISLLDYDKKCYEAEVILGYTTDTLDVTGKTISNMNVNVTKNMVVDVLKSFLGKSIQEVPKYSAVKVNGKRLYEYARNNIDVELPKREIEVFDIDLLGDLVYNDGEVSFSFRVNVSSGTYIRSMIRDIGAKLNTGAVMKNLKRVRVGNIEIDQCKKIDDITIKDVVSVEDMFDFERVIVVNDFRIKNGQLIDKCFNDKYAFIYNKENNLIALYQEYGDKAKPFMIFKED